MLLLSIIFMELNINLSVNHIFANDDVGAFGKKTFLASLGAQVKLVHFM